MSKGELIVETLIDRLRAVRAFRNLPASALTKIAQIASPPSTYQLAMTKGEVANWLGITPATLSRCLKQLVTEGRPACGAAKSRFTAAPYSAPVKNWASPPKKLQSSLVFWTIETITSSLRIPSSSWSRSTTRR